MKNTLLFFMCLTVITACKHDTEANQSIEKNIVACTEDIKTCTNGKTVKRNPNNNCEFYHCESLNAISTVTQEPCTDDLKKCPDGTYVARNPDNNCQFLPCKNNNHLR